MFLTRTTHMTRLVQLFTQQQQFSPLATLGILSKYNDPSLIYFVAVFLVGWGLGVIPLSFRFFPHVAMVRAANFALIASGSLLFLLSPDRTIAARAQLQST